MKNIIILTAFLTLVSCGNNEKIKNNTTPKEQSVSLAAVGATFPLPFYNSAIKTYSKKEGTHITYGGIGSGGGIRALKDRVVDFGATDAFLNDKEESEMLAPIIHIPTCLGAVVLAYNLPHIGELKLTNENISDLFMGKITKWNDKRLKASNPNVKLPNLNVSVIHRSDGSGTTYIFSDYMSKISHSWETQVGRGKALKWPVGMGAKGNPGVAGQVQQVKGALGYIGSEFAFAQNISFAKVMNSSGNFIKPNIESISAAASGDMPSNTKVMLTNPTNPNAYPISGFTWLITYKEQNYNGRTKRQAEETVKFLSWIVESDAQSLAVKVNYAPLPTKAIESAKRILGTITYDGKPIK